jgi:hypothetical protein
MKIMKINITITGTHHYYGDEVFKKDTIVMLVKEPKNNYDSEAIRVELPYIGTVGYVANSSHTVAENTMSAGRIYDKVDYVSYAKVVSITFISTIICEIIPSEKSKSTFKKYKEQIEPIKPIKSIIP